MISLYHFTCDHGYSNISKMGTVNPNYHPLLEIALSWWTDLAKPSRDAIGLTSDSLTCDRMQHRFRALDLSGLRPWLGSVEQAMTPPLVQSDLQRFSDPDHWWIASDPVRVSDD